MIGKSFIGLSALVVAAGVLAAQADGLGVSKGNRLGGNATGMAETTRLTETLLPVATKGHQIGRIPTDWFWREVTPGPVAQPAVRWARVLSVIERGRADGKAIFGSETRLRRILDRHGPVLSTEASRRDLSLPLLLAVIAVESGGNSKARSPKGAQGLMQLMRGTARRFGVSDAYKPAQNVRGGAEYLDWLLRRYGGDVVLALAGYNAGEGAVDKYGGVPPYRETRAYVAKVAGAYAAASRLCTVPPNSARAPCEVR